ncbi:MAG TPA: sortase [Patescibacteria group bacterium]|nr:sortase [Patescibacteria group bacterium]
MPKKRNSSKSTRIKRLPKKTISFQSKVTRFLQSFHKLSYRTKAFFIFGILFISISFLWHFNQTIQLAFFTPKVVPVEKTHAIPTQLIIKKIGVDLPIQETAINNGIWQVSDYVSHLTTSARPKENGPIILYGHNTIERLGPIRWLSIGDSIEIKTADNKIHIYIIDQTMTVAPDRLDVFTQKTGETLIIYTCDGFADLQRFVLIATRK